jgi:UDP-N-acetylmuramate dehydrogenase
MHEELLAELRAAGLKRVRANEPMARHTSWRVGGPADYFVIAESREALRSAISIARHHDIPWLVLGGGSNILVADAGIEGLVILNRLKGMMIEDNPDSAPVLQADAGVFFARAALFTAKRGYSGLEWGIAIPGTVGAGVVNNAGAHQGDVARTLIAAEAIDADSNTIMLTPTDLGYRYRESILKVAIIHPRTTSHHLVVTRCWFRIMHSSPEVALGRINELIRLRSETQPITQPSAGSTFKNPPEGPAGAYIERAGLKGLRIGGAEFSTRHANFIVNLGHASAADIAQLIRRAQEEVFRQFGVHLEPEIQFVGRWPEMCASETIQNSTDTERKP